MTDKRSSITAANSNQENGGGKITRAQNAAANDKQKETIDTRRMLKALRVYRSV